MKLRIIPMRPARPVHFSTNFANLLTPAAQQDYHLSLPVNLRLQT